MGPDWDKSRWRRFEDNASRWWARELDRPLIDVRLPVVPEDQVRHALPYHAVVPCYEPSVPVEAIVERWDLELRRYRFLGDSYPGVWASFGPAFLAALLGADLTPSPTHNTTWLSVPSVTPIEDLRFSYDPENSWHQRYLSFCRAATAYWQGDVQIGMCTGGILDVLSVFRPESQLLLDLYDTPEQVKRLVSEAHEISWRYYQEVNAVLRPANPGYSCWATIFCPQPYQILICDFCCMIGPEAFAEFARPELQSYANRLARSFYHLDGPDAVRHLDSLLAIERLDGIQWVPGAGMNHFPLTHWTDLYRRVLAAGKLAQIMIAADKLHEFDDLADRLGSNRGFHLLVLGAKPAQEAEIEAFLKRHGAQA